MCSGLLVALNSTHSSVMHSRLDNPWGLIYIQTTRVLIFSYWTMIIELTKKSDYFKFKKSQ